MLTRVKNYTHAAVRPQEDHQSWSPLCRGGNRFQDKPGLLLPLAQTPISSPRGPGEPSSQSSWPRQRFLSWAKYVFRLAELCGQPVALFALPTRKSTAKFVFSNSFACRLSSIRSLSIEDHVRCLRGQAWGWGSGVHPSIHRANHTAPLRIQGAKV